MVETMPPGGPAQFAVWQREMERRLAALETSRRSPYTKQQGGSYVLAPEDGDPAALAIFGEFTDGNDGSRFGFSLYDTNHSTVLAITEDTEGLLFPHLYTPWRPSTQGTLAANGEYKVVTSGSFGPVFRTYAELVAHDCLTVDVVVAADASTTGEVKLTSPQGNTATFSIGASSIQTVRYDWLHPWAVGWGDSGAGTVDVAVEARRTSGSGNVNVYWPRTAMWRNSFFTNSDAASDGNPRTL